MMSRDCSLASDLVKALNQYSIDIDHIHCPYMIKVTPGTSTMHAAASHGRLDSPQCLISILYFVFGTSVTGVAGPVNWKRRVRPDRKLAYAFSLHQCIE